MCYVGRPTVKLWDTSRRCSVLSLVCSSAEPDACVLLVGQQCSSGTHRECVQQNVSS